MAGIALPKPGARPAKQEQEEPQTPDVECGDELYFRHPKHGPTHGKVAAHGQHGCMIDCAADEKRYRVPWEQILGRRVTVQPGFTVVDHGEDGFIAEDDSGRRRYIHDPDPDVAGGEEPIRKSIMPVALIFGDQAEVLKSMGPRYIKNRPGLALRDVTDRAGHQTKRWMRDGDDGTSPKGGGRKRAQPEAPQTHPVGSSVSLTLGGETARGKIESAGKDGAHVRDADGNVIKVPWSKMRATQPASARRVQSSESESSPAKIAPEDFNAHEYAERHTDQEVTEDKVLSRFDPSVRDEMTSVNARVRAVKQTIELFKQADGEYLPERVREVHSKVWNTILSHANYEKALPAPGERPTLTLLGGRGGSGKSKLKGSAYDPDHAIVLDADEIKKMIPEYAGWNAHEVHEESSDILDQIADACRAARLNVVIDATMKSAKTSVERAQAFQASGFRIEAHYMFLPRQEAAYRTTKRYMNGTDYQGPQGGKRGRYAPAHVVLANTDNERHFDAVRKMADKWSFHDNQGAEPALVSHGGKDTTGKQK